MDNTEYTDINCKYEDLLNRLHNSYLHSTNGKDYSLLIHEIERLNDLSKATILFHEIYESYYGTYQRFPRIVELDHYYNDSIINHILKNQDTPYKYLKVVIPNIRDTDDKNNLVKFLNDVVTNKFPCKIEDFKEFTNKILNIKQDYTVARQKMSLYHWNTNGYKENEIVAKKNLKLLIKWGYVPSPSEASSFDIKYSPAGFWKKAIIVLGIISFICIVGFFISTIAIVIPFLIACFIGSTLSKK